MLFDINYQLCKTYPAFTPFDIDGRNYHDVIVLYANTKRVLMKEEKETKAQKSDVIRKPAGDNWF